MENQLATPLFIESKVKDFFEPFRPHVELRNKIDLGFSLEGQNLFLHEVRPDWKDPSITRHHPYAKLQYIKSKNRWKLYWLRASGKWESYDPFPDSQILEELFYCVQKDELGCFKG